ncbi:MAG: hypothetical protein ACRELT_14065 [Longimicrobiales bacterium]
MKPFEIDADIARASTPSLLYHDVEAYARQCERYSPRREAGTHHFLRVLARVLRESA